MSKEEEEGEVKDQRLRRTDFLGVVTELEVIKI